MGKLFHELNEAHVEFIGEQKIFFVGTATADSRVSVSPKGMDTLRVLGKNRIAWLNVTGSGNETSAHVQVNPRMTLMFCAFAGAPMILRLYGTARVIHRGDSEWRELFPLFKPLPGARQIFDVAVDLVQTSCGMAVPCYSYVADREALSELTAEMDDDGLRRYWEQKNQTSIDGIATRILAKSG